MKERFLFRSMLIAALSSGICFFCTDPVKPDFGQAPVIGNDKKITVAGTSEKDSVLYLILTAKGTDPLIFQWYKNDTLISRVSSDSLKFEPLKLSDTGMYHCIVSNKQGADTSKPAAIGVAPRFTVTYNGNNAAGGAAPADSNEYKTGATVTVLGNTGNLIKTGHSFSGWNTKADGAGANYSGGDTLIIASANVTLHAQWTVNTYIVRFNSNGGSPVDSQIVEYNNIATEPPPPTRSGYVFAGWHSDLALTVPFVFTTPITANVTLHAKWTAVYTVTYNGNTNTGGSVPVDTNKFVNGTTVTVLGNTGSLVKTGHTFSGWNTAADGSGVTYSGGATFTMGSTNVILYARWTTNPTYTVTYNGNANTSGSVPVDANNYESGATITVKGNTGSLVKTGCTFAGWNTKADGTGANYSGGDTFTMGSANVTLYARWTTNPTYTVTYNGNANTSGSVPVDANNYESGATVTIKGNTGSLVKTGCTFAGWNTKADGTGTNYSGGDTFIMGSADVTLYAKWTTNPTYTVTYNGNTNTSGSVPVDANNYESGATVTVLGNTGNLTKTGHTFANWNTTANGSGTNYAPGATFTMGSANVALHAQWTANTYTVKFNSNGGSSVDSQSVVYNNIATEPAPPTRAGYIFAGWHSDQALTVPFVFTTPITANITLHAKWTPVYTVTYNGNTNTGGSVPVDPNKYVNGATVTVLDNTGSLVKTGYAFSKWNTNAAGTGADRVPGETFVMGAANVTLYAKWAGNPYTVTFNANGGATPNPATKVVTFGSAYGTLATTSRTSYTFDGWWTGAAGTGTAITSTSIVNTTNDHTLYAKWVIKDADGNVYTEVTIGTQTWLVENLKTTKYNDGTDIPLVTDNAAWGALTTPAYCWYDNNINNKEKYGALYNWYVVITGKLAISGWRVPTDNDWTVLQEYLIANGYNWDGTTTGNKIAKSIAAKTDWEISTTAGAIGNDLSANNRSGFSAFPGGGRTLNFFFLDKSYGCDWWSATEYDALNAWFYMLYYDNDYLDKSNQGRKRFGYSVRLVRDN